MSGVLSPEVSCGTRRGGVLSGPNLSVDWSRFSVNELMNGTKEEDATHTPVVVDAKSSGSDTVASLCTTHELALPVYQTTSTPAVGANSSSSGEFVGLIDVIDCCLFLLRVLQKMKGNGRGLIAPNSIGGGQFQSPIHDHEPIEMNSEASLLIDLSGCNPFIPWDITLTHSQTLLTLFRQFSNGINRVAVIEGGKVRCEQEKYKGLITQLMALQFIHSNQLQLGPASTKSLLELNLIHSLPSGFTPTDWSDSTVIQTLTTWFSTVPPLPSYPLFYKGVFVDILTPYDLVGLVQSRIRSHFYQNCFELKCREKARQLNQTNKQHHIRAISFNDALNTSIPATSSISSTSHDRLTHSSSLTPNMSRVASRRGSYDASSGSLSSLSTLTNSTPTTSSSTVSTNPISAEKKPYIQPDSGVRFPIRKRSLTGANEDEFARAKALAMSKAAAIEEQQTKPTTARLASHSRRSTMPIHLSQLNLNATPADAKIVISPISPSNITTTTTKVISPSSRRATGEFITAGNSIIGTGANSPSLTTAPHLTTRRSFGSSAANTSGPSLDHSNSDHSSRRGDSSISSMMSRRSIGSSTTITYNPDDELTQLERKVSSIHRQQQTTTDETPLSISKRNPNKRATMPLSSSSASNSPINLAEKFIHKLDDSATVGKKSTHLTVPQLVDLPSTPTLNLEQATHSIHMMSICNTNVLIRDDTTISEVIERMVENRTTCLFRMDSYGRVNGYITGSDVFQALVNHPPVGASDGHRIGSTKISDFGLNI